MKLAICSEYPGLDPIRLLDYPLADVIDLMRQHLDRKRRTRQQAPQPATMDKGANAVRYRKADDSWF